MFEKMRNKFFYYVEKILKGERPDDLVENTKNKANKLIIDHNTSTQTQKINEKLKHRQAEIDMKNLSSHDIWKEKDQFRQKIYQTTSQQTKQSENTFEKK